MHIATSRLITTPFEVEWLKQMTDALTDSSMYTVLGESRCEKPAVNTSLQIRGVGEGSRIIGWRTTADFLNSSDCTRM